MNVLLHVFLKYRLETFFLYEIDNRKTWKWRWLKQNHVGKEPVKLWKMEVPYVLKINSFLVTIKRKKQPLWENQGKF